MKNASTVFACVVAALLASGCAGLEFYDSPALATENRIGIKFYIPKPYLLVARTGNKDKPTDISVIYLPDMKNPVYAQPKSGYGSAKLSMSFTNGMLASFGQETDTKIPESLTALGGLGKAVAEARKINREALALELQSGVDYQPFSKTLNDIAKDLKTVVLTTKQGTEGLTGPELQDLGSFVPLIEAAAKSLGDPINAPANAPAVIATLKQIQQVWKRIADPTGGVQPVRQRIAGLRNQLQAVVDGITPKSEDPTFTLYEIDNSSGTTILREVKL